MSNFDFNDAQRVAITSCGENLLVAAGAGSGKTTVLVSRIIRYLEEGGAAERLLVLTFTHAAADDMRAKIDNALTARLEQRPDDGHLRRQLALLPQAHISTIHSFCLELLKRYYYRLELPAAFRVASEVEAALLRREVLEDFLEAEYAAPDSPLPQLADAYGGPRDDSQLTALLLALYKYSQSRPEPLTWLRQSAAVFSSASRLDDYPFADFLSQSLALKTALAARPLELARQLTFSTTLPLVWRQLINDDLAGLNRLREAATLSGRLAALRQLRFGRLPSGKHQLRQGMDANTEFDEADKDRFRALRNKGKEAMKDLAGRFGAADDQQLLDDLHQTGPLLMQFVELIARFDAALKQEKQRQGLIDFNDMEHLARKLLLDDEIAAQLRESFDEVLVDEYQDINEVQESLFARLTNGHNFFAVGDVKQSIYRFRLAEPRLFLHKYQAYGAGQGGRRIDLNDNYRSDISIIRSVNFLFRQLMYEQVAELDYDAAAELKPGRDAAGQPAELHLLDLSIGESEDEELSAMQAEARLLARRIAELHEQGYAYGDMAILLRSLKRNQAVIIAELQQAGLPVLAGEGAAEQDSPELALFISILNIIDNPRQDIALAAALRSPLFGFSDDDLAALRLDHREGDFYAALLAQAEETGPLAEQCRAFLTQLGKWRQLAGRERMDKLLLTIYQDTAAEQLLGAMANGAVRLERLRRLYDQAHQYDESGYAGLFRFIRLLADGREQGFSPDQAPPPAERADAVRLLSIHKSKGLEFPVVLVAGLNSQYNFQDEYADLIWERSLGLGARRVDLQRRCKYPTLSHVAIAQKMRAQALAEEMRVLYVALTRPRERLILTAAARELPRLLQTQAERLGDPGPGRQLPLYVTATAQKPLDWLLPALLRHADSNALRELAGCGQLPLLEDDSCWLFKLWSIEQLSAAAPAPAPLPQPADPQLQERLRQILRFRYPGRELCDAPVKYTVSELNRLRLTERELEETALSPLLAPAAAAATAETAELPPLLAAERGIAYHLLLEKLDLRAVSAAQISAQISAFIEQGRLSPEQAALLDAAKIARLLALPLGRRLCQASQVQREIPFTLASQPLGPDSIIIQGVLDAAFREEDGWVLLDYKTGGRGKSDDELRQLYQQQLQQYAEAIERLWRAPVREKHLLMLDLGRSISC